MNQLHKMMAVPGQVVHRAVPFCVGLSPLSVLRASSSHIQGWKRFFRLCHGRENQWKQIGQGGFLCHIACPVAGTDFIQYRSWTRNSSMSSVRCLSRNQSVCLTSLHACLTGLQFVRHRSGGKKSKGSSSSSDEESDQEELDEDDYEAPVNFKKMKIYVKSLRTDSVVSSGLDISRNRVDEIFYGSRLRLNGEKLLKKSKQMDEGDYVDVVMERLSEDDQLLVKRVKVVGVSSERTNKDKTVVTVKVWKSPFPVQDASRTT